MQTGVIPTRPPPPESSATPPVTPFLTPSSTRFLPGSGRLRAVRGGAEDLLTVRDVAARLHVSTATVYTLANRGELPHIRIANTIRVAPADLEAYVQARRSGGRP